MATAYWGRPPSKRDWNKWNPVTLNVAGVTWGQDVFGDQSEYDATLTSGAISRSFQSWPAPTFAPPVTFCTDCPHCGKTIDDPKLRLSEEDKE